MDRKGLIVLAVAIILLSGRASGAEDYGHWGSVALKFPLSSRVDFLIRPELRLSENAGEFTYFELQSGLAARPSPYLGLAAYFAFIRSLDTRQDRFNTQYLERLDITPRGTLLGVPISLRNRFEFRQMNGGTNRYRARFQLDAPRPWTRWRLSPYLADESFYDFDLKRYNQNRFFAGVLFPVDMRTDLNLYYLRQASLPSRGGWTFQNVIGTEIRWRFR